jgi:DNA invertase Pin-like site-specific DNA recombinase
MNKRVAIYTRVSTDHQTTANQDLLLNEEATHRRWSVVKTFNDAGISGKIHPSQRPAMAELIKKIERHQVDMVAVYDLSRLGRTVLDLAWLNDFLQQHNVNLYVHNLYGMQVDTATPMGKLFFHLIAAIAQFERENLVERTQVGIQRAKKHGTKSGKAFGRPKVEDDAIKQKIYNLRQQGTGYNKIATQLGIGSSTVRRIIQEEA